MIMMVMEYHIDLCQAHTPKVPFFTRGSGHNKFGGYTEDGEEYKRGG